MGPQDIALTSLLVCLALLIIPLSLSILIKLKLIRKTLFAVVRMSVQLFLMAIYLNYLFKWNSGLINCLWLLVMILVATFSVIKNSELNRKMFLLPVFLSLTISVVFVILYFNMLILRLENILQTKYFIVIGGMLLGNSLRGNIIGISNFYREMKRNEERYLYHLSAGATVLEASMPYLRNSLMASLHPSRIFTRTFFIGLYVNTDSKNEHKLIFGLLQMLLFVFTVFFDMQADRWYNIKYI